VSLPYFADFLPVCNFADFFPFFHRFSIDKAKSITYVEDELFLGLNHKFGRILLQRIVLVKRISEKGSTVQVSQKLVFGFVTIF
jgi:hypothetical protein